VLRRACCQEELGWARRGRFGAGRREKKGKGKIRKGKGKGRKGKKEEKRK
jgi:hypothetical protein